MVLSQVEQTVLSCRKPIHNIVGLGSIEAIPLYIMARLRVSASSGAIAEGMVHGMIRRLQFKYIVLDRELLSCRQKNSQSSRTLGVFYF
jgi:hypothetical protein